MAKNFKALATSQTIISELFTDREKLTTTDVIAQFPDGATIADFDIVEYVDDAGEIQEYCVIVFAEDENKFYCGGALLTKIIKSWVGNDNILDVRDEYKTSEPVAVKLSLARTKRNNNITKVEIL